MTILDTFTIRYNFRVDRLNLERMERSIAKIRQGLDTAAVTAGIFGTALTAAAGLSLKGFADVESKFATIEGLVGISRMQLDAWAVDLERIAKETGKAPAELVDALFFITSAGFRGAEAMDILEQSAKASAAGLGEQAVIADLLTSALGVYTDGTLDSAAATDQLTAAIREGKLDPATMAGALARVLPFAKEAGVEFGEVAGAMAAMSRQGINAAQGATTLRGIFGKIIKPTKQGQEVLAEYGLTIDDLRKVVADEGLVQGLRMLRAAFGDNDEAIAKVFESEEALLGVLALSGETAAENAEIIGRVTSAYGDLDAAILPVTRTLNFRASQAFAHLSTQIIDMGSRLAPMAHQLLDLAMATLDWYSALGDGPKDFIAQILAMGPALIGAGVAMKGLSIALGGLVPLISAVALPLNILFGIIAAHPLLALVTATALVITNWEKITEVFQNAGQALSNIWDQLANTNSFDVIKTIFESIQSVLPSVDWAGIGSSIGTFIKTSIANSLRIGASVWTAFIETVAVVDWYSVGHRIGTLIMSAIPALFGLQIWNQIYTYMADSIAGVDWGLLGRNIGTAIQSALVNIFMAASSLWSGLVDSIGSVDWVSVGITIGTSISNGVVSIFTNMHALIAGIDWGGVGSVVVEKITTAIGVAFQATTTIWNGLITTLEGIDWPGIGVTIGTAIRNAAVAIFGSPMWDDVFTKLHTAIAGVDWGNLGYTIGSFIRESLLAAFGAVISGGLNIWSSIFDSLGSAFRTYFAEAEADGSNAVLAWAYSIIRLLVHTLAGAAELVTGVLLGLFGIPDVNPFSWIREMFQEVMDSLWDLIPEPIQRILNGEIATATIDAVTSGLNSAGETITGAVSGVMGKVRDLLPDSDAKVGPLSDLTESGRALLRTLASGVSDEADLLRNVISDSLELGMPVAPPITEIQTLEAQNRQQTAGNQEINLTVEKIEIMAPGGDPKEIAEKTAGQLRDQIRRAVESADSQVLV